MDALDLSPGRKARAAAPARQQPVASEQHVEQLAASERRARWTTRTLNWLLVPLSLVLGVLGWQWLVVARNIPPFILPPPTRVATRFASAFADGTWWTHTSTTLVESLLGFALGFAVASVLGYILAHAPAVERFVSPYIAASQALPVVAIAPLLLLWLGFGLLP
jgi:NitT/TauT family transport system permease protein